MAERSHAGVPHWRPTIQLCISIRSAAKVGGGGWSGTKIHQKRQEIFGAASTTRQDMKHTGLSGSRGRPAMGLGCFVQTGLETTRTRPKATNRQALAGPDKLYFTDRPG